MKDNRNYHWIKNFSMRPEFPYIENWITNGSKVIDLACGNGSLLALLKEKKRVFELGIEITQSGVDCCVERGINARAGRIDVELKDIPNDSFDFSICNVTLQMVMYPEVTLQEMKRISKYQIVSFPNFGHLLNRIELLFEGRMPTKLLGGYSWYNTGYIHQLSIKDFEEIVSSLDLTIKAAVYSIRGRKFNELILLPNLFAAIGIFLTEK